MRKLSPRSPQPTGRRIRALPRTRVREAFDSNRASTIFRCIPPMPIYRGVVTVGLGILWARLGFRVSARCRLDAFRLPRAPRPAQGSIQAREPCARRPSNRPAMPPLAPRERHELPQDSANAPAAGWSLLPEHPGLFQFALDMNFKLSQFVSARDFACSSSPGTVFARPRLLLRDVHSLRIEPLRFSRSSKRTASCCCRPSSTASAQTSRKAFKPSGESVMGCAAASISLQAHEG